MVPVDEYKSNCMSINLGVQWWQSCDNSYNFNQIKIFFTQIERENRYVLYTFKKQNYFPFFSQLYRYRYLFI